MSESPTRVLVTGGATGIGAAITQRFLANGASVAVSQRTPDSLRQSLESSGLDGQVSGLVADLSDEAAATRLVEEAVDALGGLDVLVNCAALTGDRARRLAEKIDEPHVQAMLAVNLGAVILSSVAACAQFRRQGTAGVIISISSVMAQATQPGAAVYTATKAGVNAFTKALASEAGPAGIRVLTVSPGDIRTDASPAPGDVIDGGTGARTERVPALERQGRPNEVADVVSFLAGPEASYITGVDITVDGGWLIR
ncbi:SDR family NAD(P)-dependent oxidoreductase [Salinibacterium sp. M195]|uniref:SDR family NAD(P)-dependent oxidoreductase n=1 Tax=Salinibacterium sp. M195 TaxID=2583374 RepID=UPI001C62A85C|nr:SDR family oxidoreductase [Salinibacterium sp. M195]QYH35273.1 SDR family oxidoreductase [Salinibacterium sp. M195]